MLKKAYLFIPVLLLAALWSKPASAFGTATSLVVTPSKLEVVAGQQTTLKVEALDSANNKIDVTGASVYTIDDPRGEISGTTYTAGKAGSWNIGITYEGLNAVVPVTVTAGPLAELVINPNSAPETVALNKTVTFSVEGFDSKNNAVKISTVDWSVSNSIGTISDSGKFTPSKIGTGTITATKGTITSSIDVKVIAARVTNTNTSTQTNTNTSGKTNSNTNVNSNTNESLENTNAATTDDTKSSSPACTSGQNWLWGLLILVLLGGVAILYAFVPVTKIWPVIIGLGAAIILTVLEKKYDCDGRGWWAWIAILGTAALTLLAFQQSPKKPTDLQQ